MFARGKTWQDVVIALMQRIDVARSLLAAYQEEQLFLAQKARAAENDDLETDDTAPEDNDPFAALQREQAEQRSRSQEAFEREQQAWEASQRRRRANRPEGRSRKTGASGCGVREAARTDSIPENNAAGHWPDATVTLWLDGRGRAISGVPRANPISRPGRTQVHSVLVPSYSETRHATCLTSTLLREVHDAS